MNFNKTEDEFRSRMEAMNLELNGLKGKIDGESQKIPEIVESSPKPDNWLFWITSFFFYIIIITIGGMSISA